MNAKIIGYSVSSFGLGIIASLITYPLGYLKSDIVFGWMSLIGIFLFFIGILIRKHMLKR